jgi:nucleotide sugar dehydrogenase
MQLGIIGNGFVGNAIAHAFIPYTTVRIHDKDPEKCFDKLDEVVNNSDVVFVCVPTPMTKSGKIDLSIVESVFTEVKENLQKKDTVFVLKSTVVPGTTRSIANKFPELNIVFNPEFLTERHARFDFLNQSRIVLGSKDGENLQKVKDLYSHRFSSSYFIETTYETAELIKYFNNLFFAVKVSFMNEMRLVADKLLDVQWDKAVEGFVSDGRVGDSHLQVPGPDGKRGFGGSCFPKDINAFIDYSKSIGIEMNVLEGAWKTNLNVRPEKDWEKLKGRAVSND